jgi:chromosome segregation protein
VDFAEVTITRRVYRSGESEYLLNKAQCRLKDIQELFMDTGIGTSAYSLIGQGKIDMVLSSKPDDRRYLFEEAAGIIKYKTRKRVALRKLDAADQNLTRLADIIAEVERQMRSLKRQVNAAIRHRELTEALRELEVRNAWLQHNELSGAIADLKESFAEAQDQYEHASATASDQEARMEELNLKRVELERTLMARRDSEYAVDSEMEKIESQIALFRRDIEFSLQQQKQAEQETESFKQRAEELNNTQTETSERAETLMAEIKTQRDALEAKQAEYTAHAEKVAELDREVETLRAQVLETINTRNRTQTEIETLAVSVSNIDGQLEGIYGRQENQNTRQEELTSELETITAEHTEKEKALNEAQEKRQAAVQQQAEIRTRLEELNEKWQTLREEKSSKEARLKSLRELRDSYEGFAAGVKAVMRAKQEGLPMGMGVIGPVGDLVSTDDEYRRAIEAALGGNINNIVVEEAENAKAAINFLKQHRAGRVTFLPLDTIRPGNRDNSGNLQGIRGVIGKAIDFVQADARVMPALEYLLYDTMIVATIDDAINIARNERRFPKLVTLDGEMVNSSGAVTGGRTKHESAGLLGRSAEIDELEEAVTGAERRIDHMSREARDLIEQRGTLEQEAKALEETERTGRKDVNDLGVRIARLTTELDSITNSGQQLSTQRDELLAKREDLEAKRKEATERVSSMDTDDAAMQERVSQAQNTAAEARQAHSAMGDELADMRVQLASLTQSLDESQRTQERERREREEALKQSEQRRELSERLKQQEKEFEGRIADNLERAKALSESKEEAHEKVVEAQEQQKGLIKEIEDVSKSLKEVRRTSETAQKQVHKLELELTQREDRLEYLQAHIVNEYNLALGSLTEKDVGTDEYDEDEREKLIQENRKSLQRLGTVNLMAIEEYEALEKRYAFLTTQEEDLRHARETLLNVVDRIDATILEMFMDTFNKVSECFKNFFRRLFNGGQARVYLLDEDDPLESGIEIEARPPGKKPQVISLLSGGEQAMTAIALLFSIFSAKPSPFCVLDEVDAPLDDANIGRFLGLVDEFVDNSQFIIITHNKQTMSKADAIFGVTQQERGVSQLVSVKFDELKGKNPAA